MNSGFIARGTGYADDKTQEGYTVLREPLPEREQRVFGREGHRVCYRAYSLKLATDGEHNRAGLFILIAHGGGTEVLAMKSTYDAGEWRAALLAMPDEILYRLLWSIYATADEARTRGTKETSAKYAQAFVDGRLKKSRRTRAGTCKVFIEDPAQTQESAREQAN